MSERKICVVGPTRSGKSHFLALLYIHLLRRSGTGHLSAFLEDRTSPENLYPSASIVDNAVRLLAGQACVPTPFGRFSEAILTVDFSSKRFGGWFTSKQHLVFPVFDSSGETQQLLFQNLAVESDTGKLIFTESQQRMIDQYAADRSVLLDEDGIINQLEGVLLNNNIYVLLFDIAEDHEIQQKLREGNGRLGPDDHQDLLHYKFSRFITNVVNVRKTRNPGDPPPQFAIVFTKHDRYLDHDLRPADKTYPQHDPYDIAGDRALLARTNIEALTQVSEAKCLVSYTNVDPDTGLFNLIPDGSLRASVPDYPAEDTYDELIQWLRNN